MHHTFICVTEQPYRRLVTVFRFWIEIRMWSFRIKLDVSFISRALPLVRSELQCVFHIFNVFRIYYVDRYLSSHHISQVCMVTWRRKGTAHVAEFTV